MKLGTRTNNGASLKLCKPKALPAFMQGPIVELCGLTSKLPGQGHARELFDAVCLEADLSGQMLFLHVDPEDGTDKARLARFYASRGFEPIQAEPLLMLRPFAAMRVIQGKAA